MSFWYKSTPEAGKGVIDLQRPGLRVHLEHSMEWKPFEMNFTVNDVGAGKTVAMGFLLVMVNSGSDKAQMWFDDVRLEMLAPEGVAD